LNRRVRRQVQSFPSFGSGFVFSQPFPNFPNVPAGGSQGSFVSSSHTLSSRLGDVKPVASGQSTVVHHKDGKFQQTNTFIRPDGSVTTNKKTGRVKRQQLQSQSQNGQSGNQQSQTQSQDQPGGQQTQFQSQGQGNVVEPIAAPVASQNLINQQPQQPQPQLQQPQQNQQPLQNQQPQNQQPQNQQPQEQEFLSDNRNLQNGIPQGNQNFNPQGQQMGQPGFGAFPFGPVGFGQGFPQFGFAPGFGGLQNPFFQFPQPAFGGNSPVAPMGNPQGPAPGVQPAFGGTLDNRFGEDEIGGSVAGGTQTFVSQNGNFQSSSSVLRPDGQVVTSQQSGKWPAKG